MLIVLFGVILVFALLWFSSARRSRRQIELLEKNGFQYEDKYQGVPWYKLTFRRSRLEDNSLLSLPFPFLSKYKPGFFSSLLRRYYREVLWIAHGRRNGNGILLGEMKLQRSEGGYTFGNRYCIIILEAPDISPGITIYRDYLGMLSGFFRREGWFHSFTISSGNTDVRSHLAQLPEPPAKLTNIETISGALLIVYKANWNLDNLKMVAWALQAARNLGDSSGETVAQFNSISVEETKVIHNAYDKTRKSLRTGLSLLCKLLIGLFIWLVASKSKVLPDQLRIQNILPFTFVEQLLNLLDMIRDSLQK